MQAVLVDYRCVSIPGLTKVWKIKPADTMSSNGQVFVRLSPWNLSLRGMVFENNSNVPAPLPNCLSASVGLEQLMKLREETKEETKCDMPNSSLFDEDSPSVPMKRARTRLQLNKNHQHALAARHEAVEVDICVGGTGHRVRLLRALHARDNPFVAYEAAELGAIIGFLRQEGFADTTILCRAMHDPAMPPGITLKKNGKFQVVWLKGNSKKGYKRCDDLNEAIAWQFEHSSATSSDDSPCTRDMQAEPGPVNEPVDEEPSGADEEPVEADEEPAAADADPAAADADPAAADPAAAVEADEELVEADIAKPRWAAGEPCEADAGEDRAEVVIRSACSS